MTLRVAVDLGTSSTCVAATVDSAAPQVVLLDGGPLMSSAVCFDGRTIFVGAEAERQAALDPSRYEPHPKSRIDEGTLLLGGAVLPVGQVIAAVLRRAVGEARSVAGGRWVDQLVLTHPADWGSVRTGVLRSAATGLAGHVVLVPEPVAAAVQHGARSRSDGLVAVLDLGGGTTDVTVLRRQGPGFRVLATRGDPRFGGSDVDQALLEHLGRTVPGQHRAEWDAVVAGHGVQEGRRRRVLRGDVRGAKEALSRHSYADVPMPGAVPDAHVTRSDLEELIAPRVAAVVELLAGVLNEAGALAPDGRSAAAVFLVGGSSRIPLVSQVVHHRLGVVPVSTDQPETVVARGALLAVAPPVAAGPPAGGAGAAPPPRAVAAPAGGARRRSRRVRIGLAAAAVLVLALGGAAVWLLPRDDSRRLQVQLASLEVPEGWSVQSESSDGELERVVVSPDGSAGAPRLRLEQQPLSPGSSLDAVATTLRAQIDELAAGGDTTFGELESGVRYGEREVLRYTESQPDGSTVDWYVVVERDLQLSVGCHRPANDPGAMAGACEQAVRTVQAGGG